MLVGIVSDTHNNLKNIEHIIKIFNSKKVDLVVHTGDVTSAKSLQKFSILESDLCGVYGNNDRNEPNLRDVAKKNKFDFREPPFQISKNNRKIAIFHEPDLIDNYLIENKDIDIVLHGHTHRYREENLNNVLIFNPGESAGMIQGKNTVGVINLDDLSLERIFF